MTYPPLRVELHNKGTEWCLESALTEFRGKRDDRDEARRGAAGSVGARARARKRIGTRPRLTADSLRGVLGVFSGDLQFHG
ncbi:MAG: hypothetical protein ACI9S9_002702 [Planctomycetota bacterium]|jgi:hypothetical protein